MKSAIVGAGLACISAGAAAQSNPTFLIDVSGAASPSAPEVTLSVHAAWDQPSPGDFVFAGADLDFVAGDGLFTGVDIILFQGPCMCYGTIRGNRIDGMSIGQVHIPQPPFKIFGNPDNPIHLYDITWTATDFTPRTVPLHTENTTRFVVTPGAGGTTIDLTSTFTPGSGAIVVVPAPGGAGLIGIIAIAVRRRR